MSKENITKLGKGRDGNIVIDEKRVMPHFLANTVGSTDNFLTMPISPMLISIWADNAVAILSLSITSVAS